MEQDFLTEFTKQTGKVLGVNSGTNYKTMPHNTPADEQEYIKWAESGNSNTGMLHPLEKVSESLTSQSKPLGDVKSPELTATSNNSSTATKEESYILAEAIEPEVYSESATNIVTNVEPDMSKQILPSKTEKLSHYYTPGGTEAPPNFKPSKSCMNCISFCEMDGFSFCEKYDYPVSFNYVCDEYNSKKDWWDEIDLIALSDHEGVYGFDYNFKNASNEDFTSLVNYLSTDEAQALKSKGIDTSPTSNKFYVFSDKSLELALKLKDYLLQPKKGVPMLQTLSSKFTSSVASTGGNKSKGLATHETPSDTFLYNQAEALSDNLEDVKSKYIELFTWKYGDDKSKSPYFDTSRSKDTNTQKTSNSSSSDQSIQYPQLYKLAENHLINKKVDYTKQDILNEYNKVVRARYKSRANN